MAKDITVREIADGYEATLRVDIIGESPEKVREAFVKLGEVILEADVGEVMVTVMGESHG